MAAKRLNMVVLSVLVVAVLIQSSLAQTTYTVGDALGWTIPSGSAVYTTWAADKTFTVGDILVFNFATGNHDVARVTKAAFDACSSTSPISTVINGPANITLSETAEHYYICTIGTHCASGQKLAINVTAGAASSPAPSTATPPSTTATPPPSTTTSPPPPPPSTTATPPSPSTTTTPSPPPPSSAASSLGVSGLSATLLSFVIALLY